MSLTKCPWSHIGMEAEDWISGQCYSYPHTDWISLWVSRVREECCWNCQIGLYTSCYERITIYPKDVGTEEIVKLAGSWNRLKTTQGERQPCAGKRESFRGWWAWHCWHRQSAFHLYGATLQRSDQLRWGWHAAQDPHVTYWVQHKLGIWSFTL